MSVRGRRLRKQSDEVTAFISSMASDGQIASHAIRANMAHMISLLESGEVTGEVGRACLTFLLRAPTALKKQVVAEDFHQLLEQEAVDSLGVDVAGYMNLGKSRNDQVATAIRMALRDRILALLEAVRELQESSLNVIRRCGMTVIPGYTHLQRAQPITVAHHFFAYFDCLQRDVDRLLQLYPRVNLSPMGSAALGGTSVKVDRERVAELLGFDGLVANAMDAVSSRDFVIESLACASILMIDVSRLSEELVLWSSKEFGFVELSDEYAASSSIMPQKKNPVVAEIARAKCGSVIGDLMAVCTIVKALPYSYNLDLQEATVHLWGAMDDTIGSAKALAGMVSTMKFNLHAISESIKGDYSTATALANYLVEKENISFRQAHSIVGELVRVSIEEHTPFETTVKEHIWDVSSGITKRIQIPESTAKKVLDPASFLASSVTKGGANPAFIPAELGKRSGIFNANRTAMSRLDSSLRASEKKLMEVVSAATKEVRN